MSSITIRPAYISSIKCLYCWLTQTSKLSNKTFFALLIHTLSFHATETHMWMMSPNIFGTTQAGTITAILYEQSPPRTLMQHYGYRMLFQPKGVKCRHTCETSGLVLWSYSVALSDLFSSSFTGFLMSPKRI